MKKVDKKVIVSIPKLSLSVITDGKTTEVKVSSRVVSALITLFMLVATFVI